MAHAGAPSPGYPSAAPLARPESVRTWSRGAAILAMLVGALALAGVLLRAPWLVGATFELGTTKANTALALMLLGAAAWMASGSRRWSTAALVPAALAGLIGAATLIQYLLGIDLGIDRLIAEPLTGTSRFPGRMPPASALSFVVLSLAIFLGTWRRLDGVADAAAGAVFGLIILVLFGVFYGASDLQGLTWVTAGLAAPTAVGLAAVCAAVVTRRADTGVMRLALSPGPDGALLRTFAPILLAVPILAGLVLAWAQWTGRIDAGVGQAFLIPVATLVIVVGTLIAARRLRSIDRRRQEYAVRLADANRQLQARFEDQTRLLGERTATLQAIVTSVPEHIYVHDPDMRFVFAGPAGAAALGLDPDHMVGRTWRELGLPANIMTPYQKQVRRVLSRGHVVTGRIKFPIGEETRLLEYTLAPLWGPDGEVRQVASIMRDVTMRVQAQERESELRRQADESAFKTDFLNRAAHELATPMTPLLLQMQILRKHAEDGPQEMRKSIDILDRNLRRLRVLVGDLLDAGRIQAHKTRLQPKPTDLRTVLEDVLNSFRPLAREKGIGLSSSMTGDLAGHLDEARIYQVFSNLFSNAIRYTPEGGHVDVTAHPTAQGLEVQVRDTGQGFSPEQRNLLFKPFSQLHDPATQKERSSGLGLYISQGIVQGHGGTIEGRSEGPGKGATFTVWLPIEPPALGNAPKQARPSRPQRRTRRHTPDVPRAS